MLGMPMGCAAAGATAQPISTALIAPLTAKRWNRARLKKRKHRLIGRDFIVNAAIQDTTGMPRETLRLDRCGKRFFSDRRMTVDNA